MPGHFRSATQVHSYTLIFSLYGQYVLPRGGEIWIGSLIRALATLNYRDGAVRTLVSRMKRKGFLESRRIGRHSFYRLSDQGRKEVRSGGDRAFTSPEGTYDGRWTVVTYSVPEKHRKQRDLLRDCLKWWGFGSLAPGTWISPRILAPEEEGKLRRLGVWEYLEVFHGEHVGPSDSHTLVAQAWPRLGEIGALYQAYIARHESALHRFEAGALNDEGCFAIQLQSLCEFVAINLYDPALPDVLLPEDWPRPDARSLFGRLQCALSEPAERFFDETFRAPGETNAHKERSE